MATAEPPVVLLGAGGHARVVAEALLLTGRKLAGHLAPTDEGAVDPLQREWLGNDDEIPALVAAGHELALGLGFVDARGAARRARLLAGLPEHALPVICHPRACVSTHAKLSPGVVICAGAVIGVGTDLGPGSLINSGAIVDHDGRVGANTHIATGAHVAGGVQVGRDVLIGVGAAVRQGICIGDGAIIGAGAVVIRDVAPGATVIGNPARALGDTGKGA